MGRRLVFDIETNGFLEHLDRVHCIAVHDLDSKEVFSFADHRQTTAYPDITDGLDFLRDADELCAHNGIDFDYQAIRKVYPSWQPKGRFIDTMILSRVVFQNILDHAWKLQRRGKFPAHLLHSPHTLEAWGYYLGNYKGDFEGPFDNWSQTMHDYCIQDVNVNVGVYHKIQAKNYSEKAIEIELELAWYLRQQKENGFPFNVKGGTDLYATYLDKRTPLDAKLRETFGSWYAPEGSEEKRIKTPKKTIRYQREHLPEGVREVFVEGAPFTKVKQVHFKPSSRDHIALVLQKRGWKPQEFTDSGAPKVDDDIISALPYPEAPLLAEYQLLTKRIGQLAEGDQAWLKLERNGFLHGSVNQSGAGTHRASHSHPNMTQVPKVGNPYGAESRALFGVPDGWLQMGADASGAQLRILGHYMAKYDGGAYCKVILEGDIHTANLQAGKPYLTTRDMAKTFIYAFLFGAGDWKIGHICRPLAAEEEKVQIGARLKRHFLRNLPALGSLVEEVEAKFKARGYFRLPTGHLVYVSKKHTALNYLIQGTEAVICKYWIVEFARRLKKAGLVHGWHGDFAALLWAHDEIQVAVRNERGLPEFVSQTATSIFPWLTEELKFRCPLAGEAKLGRNWAECH